MTLREFLNEFHIPMDENVAVFRYWAWDGAPEFACKVRELKYHPACADLLDKDVRGICSGRDEAKLWLTDEQIEEENILEIALDWNGDEE